MIVEKFEAVRFCVNIVNKKQNYGYIPGLILTAGEPTPSIPPCISLECSCWSTIELGLLNFDDDNVGKCSTWTPTIELAKTIDDDNNTIDNNNDQMNDENVNKDDDL